MGAQQRGERAQASPDYNETALHKLYRQVGDTVAHGCCALCRKKKNAETSAGTVKLTDINHCTGSSYTVILNGDVDATTHHPKLG